MRTSAKQIAWTAIVVHLLALACSVLYIAPATSWPIASMAGWRAAWFLWVTAALLYALLLTAWEGKIGLFSALAFCGCLCDAFHTANALLIDGPASFENWQRIFRFLSLGVANLLYSFALLGLNLKSAKDPRFPPWLRRLGVLVFFGALPISAAGFFQLPSWDAPATALAMAFLLPWILAVTYKWITALK